MKVKIEIEIDVDEKQYWDDVKAAHLESPGISWESAEARVRTQLKRGVRLALKERQEVLKVAK